MSDVIISLVDEKGYLSGYIELSVRGERWAICDTHWTNNDARVACRQLGHPDGRYKTASLNCDLNYYLLIAVGAMVLLDKKSEANYGLDHVNCKGNEEYLLSCEYVLSEGSNSCTGFRAGVTCFPTR